MNKITYIGIKKGNSFRVINRALLDQELSELPEGRYRFSVEKYRKNKSNAQLGYLFACIYPFVLRGLIDAGWDEITNLYQVDAFCKLRFANQEIVNKHSGEIMTVPALKREMSTTEFSTYVEAIRSWSSEYLNVYIPEPGQQLEIELRHLTLKYILNILIM